MKRWFIKLSKAGVILLVLTLVIGTIYEATSRKQASQNFPPPGKLIDIGDRRINLDCRGQGNPTVIFESGLDTLGSADVSNSRLLEPHFLSSKAS